MQTEQIGTRLNPYTGIEVASDERYKILYIIELDVLAPTMALSSNDNLWFTVSSCKRDFGLTEVLPYGIDYIKIVDKVDYETK